jgi:hypothetical protein
MYITVIPYAEAPIASFRNFANEKKIEIAVRLVALPTLEMCSRGQRRPLESEPKKKERGTLR